MRVLRVLTSLIEYHDRPHYRMLYYTNEKEGPGDRVARYNARTIGLLQV